MKNPIHFQLNGQAVTLDIDDERPLLGVLRGELGLTGTKYGCGAALCGACTVMADGQAVRACKTPLRNVAGKSVVTVEGLMHRGKLSALQQAFIDFGAFQCGYCTSGMLMSATLLLHNSPHPTRTEIVSHMERNLCRCGAHQRIVMAIEAAALQRRQPA